MIFRLKPMKTIFSTLFLLCFIFTTAQNNQLGQTFPLNKIADYQDQGELKLVIFTPSLEPENEYAIMMMTSLHHYFVQGLAFESASKPKIDLIYIVNDQQPLNANKNSKSLKSSSNDYLHQATVVYDAQGQFFRTLGEKPFKESVTKANSEFNLGTKTPQYSKLFLLNQNNEILYIDDQYAAQGEHLKPLEKFIKKHLKIELKAEKSNSTKSLKIGDVAPNFRLVGPDFIDGNEKLLDDKTAYKIITFYPAAFSGQIIADFDAINRDEIMGCAAQIQIFDHAENANLFKTYAISGSTNELLKLWKQTLGTHNVTYLNDADYNISQLYNAYNEAGYSNRATYIIDKKGIIVYADEDFSYEDELELPQIIEKLKLKNTSFINQMSHKMTEINQR